MPTYINMYVYCILQLVGFLAPASGGDVRRMYVDDD